MTPPKDSKELREATKRSIALLVAQRRGADKWDEEDLVTASNILFVTKKLMDSYAKEFGRRDYLSHFHYDDWEIGDDDKLRVGDYISCDHQRPYDGYEQIFEGQMVEHHVNKLPVIIYNLDPKEPDNSGDYADLQSLMMDGWTFTRIAQLSQTVTKEEL